MVGKYHSMRRMIETGMALLVVALVLVGCASAAPQSNSNPGTDTPEADPQRLMIPRWFLSSLTVDGQEIPVAEDQQAVTLQFAEGGNANGTGGCNTFGTTYATAPGGKMAFGPIAATKMACADGMQLENAYFQALSKVERFNTADSHLELLSVDGKTSLIFRMPLK